MSNPGLIFALVEVGQKVSQDEFDRELFYNIASSNF